MQETSPASLDFSRSGLPPLTFARELPGGENNRSFLFRDAAGKNYVVRQKKSFSTTGPLTNERDMLCFLADAGIDFAPASLYFDETAGFHVISYVGGEDIRPFEFTEAQADLFARQVAQLHGVTWDFYRRWCEKRGLPPRPPETLAQNLALYYSGPAAFIAKNCPDAGFSRWVEKTVGDCVARARARPEHPPVFVHGDLGGNMRWDGRNLCFIDWERARFLHLNELGYIFVHGRCPVPLRHRIQAAYALARGLDAAVLAAQVAFEIDMLEVDKVLWPINKFVELTVAGNPEAARYRQMAETALKAWPQS